MAYSKVILNGTTLMDVTQKTVDASNLLSGYTALKNDGTDVTGTYTPQTVNLQAKTNIAPSTSSQTITADAGYDGLSSVQINAMPSGTAGTPTATKGAVSNHAVSVTPSVTNTTGYITGGTKTGTAVSVSASELVSGTLSITENDTYDVTNYSSVDVNVSGGGSDVTTANVTIINRMGRAWTAVFPEISGGYLRARNVSISNNGSASYSAMVLYNGYVEIYGVSPMQGYIASGNNVVQIGPAFYITGGGTVTLESDL